MVSCCCTGAHMRTQWLASSPAIFPHQGHSHRHRHTLPGSHMLARALTCLRLTLSTLSTAIRHLLSRSMTNMHTSSMQRLVAYQGRRTRLSEVPLVGVFALQLLLQVMADVATTWGAVLRLIEVHILPGKIRKALAPWSPGCCLVNRCCCVILLVHGGHPARCRVLVLHFSMSSYLSALCAQMTNNVQCGSPFLLGHPKLLGVSCPKTRLTAACMCPMKKTQCHAQL